jgi:hypothetical protein
LLQLVFLYRSKLKNKTPEIQDKIRKRLAADLSDSDSAENDVNIPNKRQRTTTKDGAGSNSSPPLSKTVTVLGREMTREEYEALKAVLRSQLILLRFRSGSRFRAFLPYITE